MCVSNPGSYLEVLIFHILIVISYSDSKSAFLKGLAGDQSKGSQFLGQRPPTCVVEGS